MWDGSVSSMWEHREGPTWPSSGLWQGRFVRGRDILTGTGRVSGGWSSATCKSWSQKVRGVDRHCSQDLDTRERAVKTVVISVWGQEKRRRGCPFDHTPASVPNGCKKPSCDRGKQGSREEGLWPKGRVGCCPAFPYAPGLGLWEAWLYSYFPVFRFLCEFKK